MLRPHPNKLLRLQRVGFALSHVFALVFGSGIHFHQSLFHEHGVEQGHVHSLVVHAHGIPAYLINTPTIEPLDQDGHRHSVASVQLSALVSPNKTSWHYLPHSPFSDLGILNGIHAPDSPLACLSILADLARPPALGNVPSVRLGRSPPLA